MARLAALVVDRFGHTTEGAGLRASLGVLRRSAGLYPRRRGEPYPGVDAACPRCMGLRPGVALALPPDRATPGPDPEPDGAGTAPPDPGPT